MSQDRPPSPAQPPAGAYQHHKGALYDVMGVVRHSVKPWPLWSCTARWRATAPCGFAPSRCSLMETVERDGQQVLRFKW